MTWWNTLLLVVLALATIATCVNSEQDEKLNEEVKKRSVEEDVMEAEAMALAGDDGAADADKRTRLFRYGRGGLMRYGKRAPSVFRYGKRAPAVFRYGKRSDDAEDFSVDDVDVKRLFRWGKRSDMVNDDMKRLFRWGKRDYDEAAVMDSLADEDMEKRTVFRYGKRDPSASDKKRRVFRFGKRAGQQLDLDDFKYGRDTRNPDQPHVPFRFGDD